ncbi:NotI family restriction endonuclease [Halobaculum marinum]|uniref:NotI family restriction endonuclease n=1 Tax=Halobaculum marinum TaxID=3031996 RepID=A0ABD5X5J4_9EURY|nr:NotI family restriction endonuclease [Halobaculum sp. DT55]
MPDTPLFREVYGFNSTHDIPERREQVMETKSGRPIYSSTCPFNGYACTKATDVSEEHGETRPLGVCSASGPDGNAVITCPERFKSDVVWDDMREHLFPDADGSFFVLEERTLGEAGRIDLIPVIHRDGEITDFAAVEIQSSYFSGGSIREEFNEYMDEIDDGHPPDPPVGSRQMDYRSCLDKRLLPQLEEKAETVEAWGKDFGVVLQKIAFENSNIVRRISRVPEDEATFFFFVYEYVEDTPQYRLELDELYPTTFEEVDRAVGESMAPDRAEFLAELERKLGREL